MKSCRCFDFSNIIKATAVCAEICKSITDISSEYHFSRHTQIEEGKFSRTLNIIQLVVS